MLSLTFFPKSLTNHPAIEAEDAVAFLETARGADVGAYFFNIPARPFLTFSKKQYILQTKWPFPDFGSFHLSVII